MFSYVGDFVANRKFISQIIPIFGAKKIFLETAERPSLPSDDRQITNQYESLSSNLERIISETLGRELGNETTIKAASLIPTEPFNRLVR